MINPMLLAVGSIAIINAALFPKARMHTLVYAVVAAQLQDWPGWAFLTLLLFVGDVVCNFNTTKA